MTVTECKQVFGLLSEYLDEELPPDVCEQIEGHISGCAPCVEFVESLRKTIELCRSLKARQAPGPLPAPVRQELLSSYHKALSARRSHPAD